MGISPITIWGIGADENSIVDKVRRGAVGTMLDAWPWKPPTSCRKSPWKNPVWGFPSCSAFDVIHGHKTIFPIPLWGSCHMGSRSVWQKRKLLQPKKLVRDGISWVYAPT
ncbi:MAG: hypothetical protein ACLR23_00105 [Clostridia bacterium]